MADDYIKLANQGAKRNLDISAQLRQALSFLPELGVTAEVFSGGQSSKEEFANGTAKSRGYTGSTRHVHGEAGDFYFYRGGKRLDWANPQDLPIFEEIVRRAKANGVTGFGAGAGYMRPGSIHIGFGKPGVWGAGGHGENAAQWLRNAYNSAGQGSIPVEQEAALAGAVNAGTGQQPDQLMTSPTGVPDADWTKTMGGPSNDVLPRSGPSWNDVAWAVNNSMQIGQYGAWLTDLEEPVDMDWVNNPSQAKFGKSLDRLNPDETRLVLETARSAEHVERLRSRLDRYRRDSETFANSYTALPLAIAANVLDPISLLAGGILGKATVLTSNALRASTSAGLVTRMAEGGIIALGDTAVSSTIQAQVDPNFGADDIAMNALTGFALGTALSSLGRAAEVDAVNGEIAAAFGNRARNMLADKAEGMGYKLSPKAEKMLRPEKFALDNSVGAARNAAINADTRTRTEKFADWLGSWASRDAMLRYKAGAGVADIMSRLFPDLSGTGGRQMRGAETAWEVKSRLSQTTINNVERQFQNHLDDYIKETGISPADARFRRGAVEQQFDNEVQTALLYPHTAAPDSAVQRQADAYREGYRGMLKEAKESGASWAKDIPEDDYYVPFAVVRHRHSQVVEKIGRDGLVDVIKQAFLRAQPDLYRRMEAVPGGPKARKAAAEAREAKLERLAERYLKMLEDTKIDGKAAPRVAALGGDSENALREMLVDNGVGAAEVEEIIEGFGFTQKKGPGNFRRRAIMEREEPFIPKQFASLPNARDYAVSLRDLTNPSARDTFDDYVRSVSAHVALQKAGFKSESELRTLLDESTSIEALKRAGRASGLNKTDLDDARRELSYLIDRLMGYDTTPNISPKTKMAIAIAKDLPFIKYMQQSGIAQLGDMPMIAMRYGVANVARTAKMKDFFRVFKRGGNEADDLLREIQADLGVGIRTTDKRLFVTHQDMNIDNELFDADATTKILARVHGVTQSVSRITSQVSLQNPVNDFLQTTTARAASQRFIDIASGKVKASKKWMNEYGLGEAELRDIRLVAGHMTLDKKSGLILRWNSRKQRAVSKEQADAYDRFLGLVRREVNRTIIEPSPNAIKRNFSGPMAGLVLQLKSYMLNALAVNTAGSIKLGPAFLAMSLLTTSVWGSMVYAAQQYVNSFGRDDQKEFLDKRLSAEGILAGGFQRSAVSSIFPMIIDSMAGAYGIAVTGNDERFFTNTRSSGLGSDIFTGIPIVSTLNDAGKLVSGVAAAALRNDQRLDETEARGFRDFLPLARTQGLLQATNAILELAPEDTDGAVVRAYR